LELDALNVGPTRLNDHFLSRFQITFMVGACFGNDVHRLARANQMRSDLYGFHRFLETS
jgi:hypothetical protein